MCLPHGNTEMHEVREVSHPQSMRAMTAERAMDGRSPQQNHNETPNGHNNYADANHQVLDESPMSMSSEWPEEDPMPLPYERKRNSSPSMLEDVPTKRHQAFFAGGDLHASQRAPENMGHSQRRHSPLDNRQAKYINGFARQQYSEQAAAGLGISGIDIRGSPLNRRIEDSFWGNNHSSKHESFLRDDRAHAIVNERSRFARAQTQEPRRQYITTPRKRSHIAPYKTPEKASHREYQDLPQGNIRQDFSEHRGYQVEPEHHSESRAYKRFSSVVPEVFRGHADHEEVADQPLRHFPVQAPQLGSPIWAEKREQPRDFNPLIRVAGNYVVTKAGNNAKAPHPNGDQSRYFELDPRTPDNHRTRGRSVAPHNPASHRGRSSSRRVLADHGSQSRSRSNTQPSSVHRRERSKSVYHTPLATPLAVNMAQVTTKANQHIYAESEPDTDSPMLEDLLRTGRRVTQGAVKASPYDVRQVLPQNNMFSTNRLRPQPSAAQTPRQSRAILPEQEVINLISPENSDVRPPPAPVRLIPMKDRIFPAKRSSIMKAPVTKPNVAAQNKPKPERVSKVENTPQYKMLAEIERQKKHAEVILEKEELAKTEALQLEIFGEVVPEDAETKKKREEKERAENQRKREEAQAEKLMKQEEKRLAELEKVRLREEAAEKVRIARDIEEAKNKVRRDAERKKLEAAEALQREKLRQQAEARIQAEREKKAAEDMGREREKQRARAVQVEAAALARFKAKQEEAKKQAASLSFPKLASTDEGTGIAGNTSHPADNSDDVSMNNPLFVRDDPPPNPK
jgi:hypothetical protein